MKIRLTIVLVFFALISNAQMLTYKVNPYTFNDETKKSVTIIGIRAKMISNIECNLSDSTFFREFYIDFEALGKGVYGALNTNTNKMSNELATAKGISIDLAKAQIMEICRNLEYGTILQKYEAAKALAGGYGYTLKSLAEQQE